MRLGLLTFFDLLLLIAPAFAQNSLDHFSASQVGETVRLKFTMSLGAQCTGIKIYRGIDTLSVDQIGEIPGICGSTAEPVTYFFTDYNPVYNTSSYYQLDLSILGFSDFVKFRALRFNDQDVLVYPNPVTTDLNLNIKKPFSSPVELQMINIHGEVGQAYYYSAGDAITADVAQLPRGIYFLKVLVDEQVVKTEKLILQ